MDITSQVISKTEDTVKLVFSRPKVKNALLPFRILFRPIRLKDPNIRWQMEETRGKQIFHQNLSDEAYREKIASLCASLSFSQINLFTKEEETEFLISKKGKVTRNIRKKKTEKEMIGNNKEKNYLINPGDDAPFLVDLGIFSPDGKLKNAMQDKFRQINRFLELLDQALRDFGEKEISILDFGCGKSYLTFVVYYYFSRIRKMQVRITGYDLKEDVVENCRRLAEKYGYENLNFVVADVTRDVLSQEKIDMVISLHACDVATDFALFYALQHKVPFIFSVPCCQHEIQGQIHKGGEMDLFLSHGLFKERFCALLTDAFRTKILEKMGYGVDVIEFVDFAHSPKNIMLRAKKKKTSKAPDFSELHLLQEKYGINQKLLSLVTKEIDRKNG